MIISIDSPLGTITDDTYPNEAIIVTNDKKKGAERINDEREKNHKKRLPIEVMPKVMTLDNLSMASTHMRSGFMDKTGKSILQHSWFSQNLSLPEHLRGALQKPFSQLLTDGLENIKNINPEKIVTVGDVTTKRFIKEGIYPKLSVIDFVVERKQTYNSLKDFSFSGNEKVFHSKNPPGTITVDSWNTLLSIVEKLHTKSNFILEVSGEEDLFVLPLLVVLPYGFFVFYGQPQKGLVQVLVDKKSKQKAASFMNKFVSS